MQDSNPSQAETTRKPVHPVSEPQPVLSGVYEVEGLIPLPTSEENPAAPQEAAGSSPSLLQLSSELLLDAASSQGSSMSGQLSFQDEIAALRSALQRLQESFSKVDSLEEQLKLTKFIPHLPDLSDQAPFPPPGGQACGAINHTKFIPHLMRELVRAQHQIRALEPSEFNQAVDRAINIILKEKRFI